MTPAQIAAKNAYNNDRRARLRKAGLCTDCGVERVRPGVTRLGVPYTRCDRCTSRQGRLACAWQAARRRAGYCVCCPRKMPKGDRRWRCTRCRRRGNRSAARRLAA